VSAGETDLAQDCLAKTVVAAGVGEHHTRAVTRLDAIVRTHSHSYRYTNRFVSEAGVVTSDHALLGEIGDGLFRHARTAKHPVHRNELFVVE